MSRQPEWHWTGPRWRYLLCGIGLHRFYFSSAFMWLNRAVFQPQRIKLPEDNE